MFRVRFVWLGVRERESGGWGAEKEGGGGWGVEREGEREREGGREREGIQRRTDTYERFSFRLEKTILSLS